MAKVRQLFFEFKSIFTTDNVLKENERHANVVTATTMLNLFFVIFISWILSATGVFDAQTISLGYVVINALIALFVPALVCFILRGNSSWLKFVLMGMFVLFLATIDGYLTYTSAFLMVIPVILSARYYKRYFTILISILTFLFFSIASFITGVNSLANLREIISALLLYYVVSFAAVQISQSGKKMIEKQKEITDKSARIETELNLANSIQQHMLPSIFPPFPEHKEIDLYASMKPAKEVGGDFYDMFLIDDKHLVINIADVSGKGVPAALFMMISKILIKNVAGIEGKADVIFKRVNKMLCDGNKEDIFVTSWLGILNLETGKLEFANAGHNPPLVYSKKNNKYEFLRTEPNMVIACMDGANYVSHETYLEPGDRIFLYTDGVTESTNLEKGLYGENRLKEFLNNHLNLDIKENIEGLLKDISEFVGEAEQFDDITMLELHYKGKEEAIENIFKAELSELPKVQEFIASELKNNGSTKDFINQINLVTEEIFSNICNYAYEKLGDCKVKLEFDNNLVDIIFEDSGKKFNPLEKEKPNINGSASERNVGGLGIYMSKNMMDNISYEYKDNKNILKITKKIK